MSRFVMETGSSRRDLIGFPKSWPKPPFAHAIPANGLGGREPVRAEPASLPSADPRLPGRPLERGGLVKNSRCVAHILIRLQRPP